QQRELMDANNHGGHPPDAFLPAADLEHPLQNVNHQPLQAPPPQPTPPPGNGQQQVAAQPANLTQLPSQQMNPQVSPQIPAQTQAPQQPDQQGQSTEQHAPMQQTVQQQQLPHQPSPQQQMQAFHQSVLQHVQQVPQNAQQQQQLPPQPQTTALPTEMTVAEAATPSGLPNPPPTVYPPRAALEVAAALMLDYRALLLKYREMLPAEGQEILDALEERGRRGIGAVVSGEMGPVAVAVAGDNG
ncbi:hypothetical protein HK097_006046, partial [Rhizophlyctis rosea]